MPLRLVVDNERCAAWPMCDGCARKVGRGPDAPCRLDDCQRDVGTQLACIGAEYVAGVGEPVREFPEVTP